MKEYHKMWRHMRECDENRDRRHGRPHAMRGEERGRFGPRGFGRHGERHEEGRGRRRMFEGGELRLVMLLLMEAEPRHGYDIIREIETRTGGAYAPSPGIVYPTLTLLEDMTQIESGVAEGSKKLYAITQAGRDHLDAHRAEAEAALARLDALRAKDEAMEEGPVFRALTNLKAVLKQRLSEQSEKAFRLAIADEIDEAARKIERL